jgi:anti-sigma regulatory factor (Ser/Thr protein kinase)
MSEGGLGLTIINALVDSMEQTEDEGGGSVLRLVKQLPPPSSATA